MPLLTDEFISSYPDSPEHMSELGSFVFYRTYSRWLNTLGRRETWKETVRRSVEYSVGLAIEQYKRNTFFVPYHDLQLEAEQLFDNIFNLRQFLSGRTHWVGGGEGGVADKFPLANFNCSFINVSSWDDLGDLFYLLLVGTGVGFKCTKDMAKNLAPVRTNFTLQHSEYNPVPKHQRLESTQLRIMENGYAKIYVGDSKEGWVDALRKYFEVITSKSYEWIHTIKISYNSIRPKGERLKTFGGTASGHEPLKEMFEGFYKVINNTIDPHLAPLEKAYEVNPGEELYQYSRVRPIHILDMGNLIGNNVVVGGVRRTAEIFLCDADDWESILAKYGINGIWNETHHELVGELLYHQGVRPDWWATIEPFNPEARPLHHRRMSNNSVAFTSKPSREMLHLIFTIMQGEGEPGFVNLEQLARRRYLGMGITDPNQEQLNHMMEKIGMNPCAEIDLWTYGVCNLTTVNVKQFVYLDERTGKYKLDFERLEAAQRLSARAGLRMTTVTLELPHWDKVQKRDVLLGTSLTGWKDAMALLGVGDNGEKFILAKLREIARREADMYAKEMRVPSPTLVSTVKPEGTLSQVAGGVSSGLHWSHSPYYIRRIRINSSDPLAEAAKSLGWTIHAEVGTPGSTEQEKLFNARTLVIDFPVDSGSKVTKNDITALQQLSTYFRFQEAYSEHNSSNTITVRPDEWEGVEEEIFTRWDEFTAVSFLSHDGGSYALAPYEECTQEEYETLKASMRPFSPEVLQLFEKGNLEDLEIGTDGCESGICPVR
jgi:adenosylcobalamin-dependent ribonucleoside-triphosphate reductase